MVEAVVSGQSHHIHDHHQQHNHPLHPHHSHQHSIKHEPTENNQLLLHITKAEQEEADTGKI